MTSYDRAIALKPDNAEALINRGNALKDLNRFEEALASYYKAVALKPDSAEAFNYLAIELMELGRLDEARSAVEQAINLAPRKPRYYHTLGNVSRYVARDQHVQEMEKLARDAASLSIDDRIELHFALAKAYEDLSHFDDAFEQLSKGNALKRGQITYNEALTLGAMIHTQTIFTSEFIRARQNAGNASSLPVFIIGMPRSGSTLVEQILASHPLVFGGGELRHFRRAVEHIRTKLSASPVFPVPVSAMADEDLHELGSRYLAEIKQLAPGAARITNKMTGNFGFAGLIHLTLPKASIIHTVRDPIDTCISCFSKLFTDEQDQTYDLAELGRYYRHYDDLMAHWYQVLPPFRILKVRYEDVIADLEGQARRIIAHCGLDWDDHCLVFHETQRPVRTASAAQVRQPIYKTAIGRWRLSEQVLRPLLAELNIADESGSTPITQRATDSR